MVRTPNIDKYRKIIDLVDNGVSHRDIQSLLKTSPNTIQKAIAYFSDNNNNDNNNNDNNNNDNNNKKSEKWDRSDFIVSGIKNKIPEYVEIAYNDLKPSIESVFKKWSSKEASWKIFKNWFESQFKL